MTDVFPATPWLFALPDEAATAALAARVADWLRAGDLVTLSGELGSGKTTFARALLRRLAGQSALEVPSPTFTLVQFYDGLAFPLVHADLYRVESVDEIAELGWDEAAEGALVVVEWADRLGDGLARDRLDVAFSLPDPDDDGRRQIALTAYGRFAPRLRQAWMIDRCLAAAGFEGATRQFMIGDASTRAYERLTAPDGRSGVLMLSPPRADAPVVRYGKPYYVIARLAPDIRPFVAIGQALKEQGLSAPAIHATDLQGGLAVLEDLGSEPCVDADGPMPDRYLEAVTVLATLHGRTLPTQVPLSPEATYDIPPYDLDALLVEVELMIDWYAPQIAEVVVPASARVGFMAIFAGLFERILAAPTTWTLRDFHSPNLIWLPERVGTARVGLVDFQDCVLGHPAYDLASLLQDARVTVPDPLELRLLGAYGQMRRAADPAFSMGEFTAAYAILGVQRATKLLGIFARLDKRDRKPHYLVHLPRIEAYLVKGLEHPALAELRDWYQATVPHALRAARAAA